MKNFKTLIEEITNVAGDGTNIAGLGDNPPVKPKKVRKRDKFAGCEVFEVSPGEYSRCMNGRIRYERWSRKLNMEESDDIRSFAHKNPTSSIIVKNSQTGEMAYLMKR